jgi:DNA-binding NtrC family response regulator
MDIAIFENEKEYCETMFKAANILHFDGKLKFNWFASSQDIGALENIEKYKLVLIDLELSPQTEYDGYALLKEAIKYKPEKEIIILTGASKVIPKLIELDLPKFKIIKKPVNLLSIKETFENALS